MGKTMAHKTTITKKQSRYYLYSEITELNGATVLTQDIDRHSVNLERAWNKTHNEPCPHIETIIDYLNRYPNDSVVVDSFERKVYISWT